jgi:hypothetical protein
MSSKGESRENQNKGKESDTGANHGINTFATAATQYKITTPK